jgi:hypothetical protein
VTDGRGFRLRDVDPADTWELNEEDKPRAREALRRGIEALSKFQEMLSAQYSWALLAVFQAVDAAGTARSSTSCPA